jgi:hypothetical protein
MLDLNIIIGMKLACFGSLQCLIEFKTSWQQTIEIHIMLVLKHIVVGHISNFILFLIVWNNETCTYVVWILIKNLWSYWCSKSTYAK